MKINTLLAKEGGEFLSIRGGSMGDIVDAGYYITIGQYPQDIVSDVEAREEVPEEKTREVQPENGNEIEDNLGQNIDVTV